jgi:limonene 1,2-monooxygenase
MSRGRVMLGCGPGALASDAYMMGIPAETQRRRMEESLAAITALLACEAPVSMQTDWFTLKDARLHLAPYTAPRFPISVATSTTPSGAMAAAKHGLGMLSLGAGLPGGPQKLAEQWRMAENEAAKHGKTMDRANWRLVVNLHVAEDDETAIRQVRLGERAETETYFGEVLARPPSRSSSVSPQHRIGVISLPKTALTFLFTSSSVSPKISRRSECPTITCVTFSLASIGAETSPVNAPFCSK